MSLDVRREARGRAVSTLAGRVPETPLLPARVPALRSRIAPQAGYLCATDRDSMHLHVPSTAPASALPSGAPDGARADVLGETWEVPRVSTGWAVALVVVAVLLALAVSPPWLPRGVGAAVHAAFALVCHQIDGRSFHAHGVAFAVCHRCTGIYAGLVVGVLAWPLVRDAVERWMSPRVVGVLALVLRAHRHRLGARRDGAVGQHGGLAGAHRRRLRHRRRAARRARGRAGRRVTRRCARSGAVRASGRRAADAVTSPLHLP